MSEKVVVADSGLLIALAIIDHLSLLSQLFSQVILPEEVFKECTVKPEMTGAMKIATAVKRGDFAVVPVTASDQLNSLSRVLDDGEAAAITLAEEHQSLLLIDERKGRKVASAKGLRIIGTGAILVQAKRKGMISEVQPLLDTLQHHGYRLSLPLYRRLIELAGER